MMDYIVLTLTAMTPVELASMSVSCVNLQHGEKCHKPYRRWWQRENAPEIGKASYLGKFNLISSFQRRTQFQSWPDQIQNAPPVNLYMYLYMQNNGKYRPSGAVKKLRNNVYGLVQIHICNNPHKYILLNRETICCTEIVQQQMHLILKKLIENQVIIINKNFFH